jgi:predicted enzyme related to lactoylglutathione lyase
MLRSVRVLLMAIIGISASICAYGDQPPAVPARPWITVLNVTDFDRSLNFYKTVLGANEVSRSLDYHGKKMVTFGDEKSALLVLMNDPQRKSSLNHGDAFVRMSFVVADAKATADRVRIAGFVVTHDPGLLPNQNMMLGTVVDPDGYEVEIFQFLAKP